ncbi:MAG: alpha/beta hydrolase-fold protein [Polyangiaceae bacterium]
MITRPPRILRVSSEVLRSNPLGDPFERDLIVYLPPDHDPARPTPALLALAGFTGNGAMLFNADPLGDSLGARLDRLIASGACPPVVVAAPDCFTRFGGNQYIDAPCTGRYEAYLVEEILPRVEREVAVSRWGVFGKSSGGYGAIVLAMRNPDRFQAFADHSGDANFELAYLPDALEALDQIRGRGSIRAWLDAYWAGDQRRRPAQVKALGFIAMAAHYSGSDDPARLASDDMGIDLPFDLETGAFREDVWARWRAWDPVRMIGAHADALAKQRVRFVDSGTRDEYGLHWGARAVVKAIRALGLDVVHEEFDDGHMNIPYRFERSIPLLAKALEA